MPSMGASMCACVCYIFTLNFISYSFMKISPLSWVLGVQNEKTTCRKSWVVDLCKSEI